MSEMPVAGIETTRKHLVYHVQRANYVEGMFNALLHNVEDLCDSWERVDRRAHAASSDEPYEPIVYIRELRAIIAKHQQSA